MTTTKSLDAGWRTLTLREAGISLLDCVHKTPAAAQVGYPYVAIPQLKNGRIDQTDARRITQRDYEEWTKKARPQENDIVLSRRCNPGETAYVPQGFEFALGQNLVLLRSDGTSVYPPFLRWLVRSPEWWEQIGTFLNVGAVFDSLKCADVPNFRLTIPPLKEQERIAQILSSLDDKIELNRRMNETLEALARRLFKSWFVDFDPVHAKAALRREHPKWDNARLSREALPKLDPKIAELFPYEFENSKLGPIPKGWKVARIDSIADINAWTLSKNDALDRIDYIEISEVMRGEIGGIAHYQRGEEPSRARRRLRHGDTVLSTVRPDRGAWFLSLYPLESSIASTGFAVFSPHGVPWSWLTCALTSREVFEYLGHHADGGAYPAVNPALIGDFEYGTPSESPILDAFHGHCGQLWELTHRNRTGAKTLSATRDRLLPVLLSGDIPLLRGVAS